MVRIATPRFCRLRATAVLALAALVFGGALEASTITVTNAADSGAGSLRDAIVSGAADTILFATSVSSPITLTSGELLINRSVRILGPCGRSLTISGNDAVRVFEICQCGLGPRIRVELADLTITRGFRTGLASGYDAEGGGVLVAATDTLALTECTLTNNHAVGSAGASLSSAEDGGDAAGGGIENHGVLTMTRCTVYGNTARGGAGGAGFSRAGWGGNASGGGLHSDASALLINCTFTQNAADGADAGSTPLSGQYGGSGVGAGVKIGGTGQLVNCTVSANSTTGGTSPVAGRNGGDAGAGVYAGTVSLSNSLVAVNSATTHPDVEGSVTGTGHNVVGIGDGATGWNFTDQVGTAAAPLDPHLLTLSNNGGFVLTMALAAGSPATDHADDTAPTADARGRGRYDDPSVFGGSTLNADVGAFERVPNPAVLFVTDKGDCGPGTLRRVLQDAAPGDSIHFLLGGDSTIALVTGELALAKAVNLSGPTGYPGVSISGNFASRILHVTSGASSLRNLTLTLASTTAPGGGALVESGASLSLTNCTASANHSTNAGGAFANNGTLNLTHCTLTGNQAGAAGAIYNFAGTLNVRNCTITANGSSGAAGGIYSYPTGGTNSHVTSSIVAGNAASGSGQDVLGAFISGGYNLIGKVDGSTGFTNGVAADQIGSNAAPIDAQLGTLAYAGDRSTQTIPPQPCSPAIDRGLATGLAADQCGQARIVDHPLLPNAAGGDGSDIGAFERAVPPPIMVTNLDDSGAGSLRQAIADATCGQTLRFAEGLSGRLRLTSGELTVAKPIAVVGPRSTVPGVNLNGGATRILHVVTGGALTLSDLTLAGGNSGSAPGGGAFVETGGALNLNRTTWYLNTASNAGGAIALNGLLNATDCTFFSNSANAGGAIYNYGGGATILNCTITQNSASSAGGGIDDYPGSGAATQIGSTVVAQNTAPAGRDVNGAFSTSGFNLIGVYDANASGFANGVNADQTGTPGTPVNPMLDALGDNGAATPTMALLAGSPAIDKGKSFSALYDQRGALRRYDDPAVANASGGDGADIGAYEVGSGGIVGVPAPGPVIETRLAAITPNPTRGQASFTIELARGSMIELALYDPAGRRVRTLLAGPRTAGRHTVAWDGRDEGGRPVAAGLLFARLQWSGGGSTRRIICLR